MNAPRLIGPKIAPTRLHLFLLALAFTALAIYGSLVPLRFTPLDFAEAVGRFQQIRYLQLGIHFRADWVANILLFVPLSFLWLGTLSLDRSRGVAVVLFVLLVPICASLALTIEFTQLWFPPRTVSQNDIIAETLGSIIGGSLWIGIGQTLVNWARTFTVQLQPKKQIDWLLQAYFLGFLIYSVLPLDLTISVTEIHQKFKQGKLVLIPFSYDYGSVFNAVYGLCTDLLVFVPVGALVATAFTPPDRPVRSLRRGTLLGMLVVCGIELAQLLVYSRFTDTTDLITGTLGVMVGVWLARRWVGSPSHPVPIAGACPGSRRARGWFGLATVYAALLIIGYWYPFDFTTEGNLIRSRFDGFLRVPLHALYIGSEYNAIDQMLRRTLMFAPLGVMFALAADSLRLPGAIRRLLLAGLLLVAFALAMGIELGQVMMPNKVADSTEVLLCTAGAALGMFITTRIRRAMGTARPNALDVAEASSKNSGTKAEISG